MTRPRQAGPPPSQPPPGSPSDRPGASLSRHHQELLSDALAHEVIPRLIQAHAAQEIPPDLAALTGRPISPAEVQELARLVLHPDDGPARARVEGLRQRGIPVETLFLDLLAMTARYLGTLWEQDLCSFSDLTVGVGRLQQVLRDISPGLVARSHPASAPLRVLLLPAPGEQHTFGLVMVSEFFRSAGWDVAGGPLHSLDAAVVVRREWFDVVAFSLAAEMHLPRLAPAIAAVRKASVNPRVGILLGGPLFTLNPALATELGADAVAVNGSLAPDIAAKLVDTRVSPC